MRVVCIYVHAYENNYVPDKVIKLSVIPYFPFSYHFQYYTQIMCPFLNRPSNNSNGNVTITMTITVSTLASNNVSYTIFAEEVKNFYLQ